MPTTPASRAAFAGMVGPVLFVATFLIEGWLRPGYHPLSQYVSELSIGPRGGIQIVSFMLYGTLLLFFARAVAREFTSGFASRLGPFLLAVYAVCLFANGPFVMDPPEIPSDHMSWHAQAHAIVSSTAFASIPVICAVYFWRFRTDPAWRWFHRWTLAVGLFVLAAHVPLKIAQLGVPPAPPNALTGWHGLIQRAILISFAGWLFVFARAIYRNGTAVETNATNRA